MVDESVVEIFTAQVSVTSSGFDLEDTIFNGEDGDIEGSTAKIEDEDVSLGADLLVKTVGDGGSGGLVDDTENVETSDNSGVLGGLPLGVVEVGGDGDDGILDLCTEISLSSLLHLGEDHGGDLLRGESLGLVLVLDLELGLGGFINHGEGPVLHVSLDSGFLKLAFDQSLGVATKMVLVGLMAT